MGPIAVIGAGGFVGTRLVESLVLDGEREVRAIVRAYRSFASLARFGSAINLVRANAENPVELQAALKGCTTVVNLTTGTPASIIRSTKTILEACIVSGVERFIHLSTAVVYGEAAAPDLRDDSPPVNGHWMPYALAKATAEVWLRQRLGTVPCQVAVLRPGIVWGVRSPHTLNVVQALLEKRAYLVDQGRGIFGGINIDNLIACIRACHTRRVNVSGFYNVADEEVVTWRDFYAAFAAKLGYDMARIPSVSGKRFPWSIPAAVDYIQALPLVNGLYHRLKTQLPDGTKAKLKAMLAGTYKYETTTAEYTTRPCVDRELWHLQRVKQKLPTTKFAKKFGFTATVSFVEGVRRTISWLAFIGNIPTTGTTTTDR